MKKAARSDPKTLVRKVLKNYVGPEDAEVGRNWLRNWSTAPQIMSATLSLNVLCRVTYITAPYDDRPQYVHAIRRARIMARIFRKPIVVAFSFLAFLSATGIVVASPTWKNRIISAVAATPSNVAKAAYHPATAPAIESVDGDYIQGLARAVPGLVRQ
jgi:hypothetical protein